MKRKITPPSQIILDKYELELENAFEKDFEKKELSQKDKEEWAQAAKKHTELRRSKRITLSVNSGELLRFKARAKKNNIPYQTLMNVIMRQYNEGEIRVGL